jgi:uncharacterized membrane-anchored protein
MKRQYLIILAIIFQIIILWSFVIRYEILKATGYTIYIPLRGYDPTDIWRGDFVNLAYELPYSGTGQVYNIKYIVPTMSGTTITNIQELSEKKPSEWLYFQVESAWTNMNQDIIILTENGEKVYKNTNCESTQYSSWVQVEYESWGRNDTISWISPIKTRIDKEEYKQGTIKSVGPCTWSISFRTNQTDRWFVKEGTGKNLEDKIREENMYAEWKLWKNGAVMLTDILSETELPHE